MRVCARSLFGIRGTHLLLGYSYTVKRSKCPLWLHNPINKELSLSAIEYKALEYHENIRLLSIFLYSSGLFDKLLRT
jgi:hypothetical protein